MYCIVIDFHYGEKYRHTVAWGSFRSQSSVSSGSLHCRLARDVSISFRPRSPPPSQQIKDGSFRIPGGLRDCSADGWSIFRLLVGECWIVGAVEDKDLQWKGRGGGRGGGGMLGPLSGGGDWDNLGMEWNGLDLELGVVHQMRLYEFTHDQMRKSNSILSYAYWIITPPQDSVFIHNCP